MLVYPAYLDDRTHVVGGKVCHAALDEAKVAHGFKLRPTGGPGYGLHCESVAGGHAEEVAKGAANARKMSAGTIETWPAGNAG